MSATVKNVKTEWSPPPIQTVQCVEMWLRLNDLVHSGEKVADAERELYAILTKRIAIDCSIVSIEIQSGGKP